MCKWFSITCNHGVISICIVDDDNGIRDSMTRFLKGTTGFRCLGVYSTAKQALEKIPQEKPDVVLMDINMPGVDGIECTRELKAAAPEVQILMLTVYEDTDLIFRALTAGASGYLLKRQPPEELVHAIKDVHQGGSPMSSSIARKVVKFFQQVPPRGNESEGLSAREREVLQLLAQGHAYKQISAELNISMDTTRTYIRRVYEKLHVHSRTEAVLRFLKEKL